MIVAITIASFQVKFPSYTDNNNLTQRTGALEKGSIRNQGRKQTFIAFILHFKVSCEYTVWILQDNKFIGPFLEKVHPLAL